MRLAIGITVGFVLGGLAGYLLEVWITCVILDLGNLCGLVGVFITGPPGALGGSIAGAFLTRPKAPA